jgi:hypothetical protein
MRDDFLAPVKDTIARRVGFQCSRLGCGKVTAGPQDDPTRTVNIGVASHITAASPEGPRFDASLTSEDRRSPANGIWLCQTCAKLIDNDTSRYPAETLREWKALAEERAGRALEEPSRGPAAARVFGRLERLMPQLLSEIRSDLATDPLVRECVLLKKLWVYNGDGNPVFAYYFEDHPDLSSQFKILENYGLVVNVTRTSVTRYRITEDLVAVASVLDFLDYDASSSSVGCV